MCCPVMVQGTGCGGLGCSRTNRIPIWVTEPPFLLNVCLLPAFASTLPHMEYWTQFLFMRKLLPDQTNNATCLDGDPLSDSPGSVHGFWKKRLKSWEWEALRGAWGKIRLFEGWKQMWWHSSPTMWGILRVFSCWREKVRGITDVFQDP